MTIIMNDGTTAAEEQKQASNAGMNFNDPNAGAEAPQKMFQLSRLGNLVQTPLSRRSGSEIAIELARQFDDLAEKHKAQTEISTLVIEPKDLPNLRFSLVIVIVSRPGTEKTTPVAFHTLMMAGSLDDQLQPISENVANFGPIENRFTPGCTLTADLVTEMTKFISRKIGRPAIYAATAVVPLGFPITDKQAVYRLLANATTAAGTQLRIRAPDFKDLNLKETQFDAQLNVRVTASDEHGRDATGLPFRSDIIIDMNLSPLNQSSDKTQNALGRSFENVQQLTNLCGYVDFIYAPPDSTIQGGMYGIHKPTQMFRPRFIINNFESVESVSMSLQLLALLTSMKLAENHAWAGAFQAMVHSNNKSETNFRDVGALGYVLETLPGGLPGGQAVATTPDKFPPPVMRMFLSHAVYPDLVITLHIDEAGPQTWINSIFAAAGRGNENAVAALVKAANRLTGGLFNKYYDPSKPLVVAEDNRIHAGTWRDGLDRIRDINEFDHLAALNYYGKKGELDSIQLYSDSHVDTAIPLKVRLDRRWNLISNALGTSIRHTGYKRPYNLTPNLLSSLSKAAMEAGLVTSSSVNLGESAGGLQRAHMDVTNLMFNNQSTGLFSGSFGNVGGINLSGMGAGNMSVGW